MMLQARMWSFVGLVLITPAFCQSAWSDPITDGVTPGPVYLCQFGPTVTAYNFQQDADGLWRGLGPLAGWDILAQENGLVARHSDQLLVIGDGMDSLVQGDQVIQGQCVEAQSALPQLFGSEDGGAVVQSEGDRANENDPSRELSVPQLDSLLTGTDPEMSEVWVAGMLAIFDPGAWDAEKAIGLIDALSLDDALKAALKDELRAAGRDPIRIARLSRQVQRLIGMTAATTAELRARLQDSRRDLEAITRAFEKQRQRADETAQQLAAAKARATVAERSNSQKTALLENAQKALREKDAELARSARVIDALRQQLATQHGDLAELQGALDAAINQQQSASLEILALNRELAETRARLARANQRIEELRGGRD